MLLRWLWAAAFLAVIAGSLLPADSLPIRALSHFGVGDKLQHFAAYAVLAFLPALHERWRVWAADVTDDRAGSIISYRDMKGNAWETPIWQIVLHVVNHGTHHRGQAAGFLRSLGHTPPPLDEIAYFREQAAARRPVMFNERALRL